MDDSIFSKDGYRWDWYSVLISEPIDELSNELYEYAVNKSIKSPRGLSRQQLQEKREALKDIAQRMISALYIAYWSFPKNGSVVSVPSTASLYQLKSNSPRHLRFSHKHTMTVRDSLEALNWVKLVSGCESKGFTRLIATPVLIELFESIGYRWHRQMLKPKSALIELKDVRRNEDGTVKRSKKGKTSKHHLPVPQTCEVQLIRDNLAIINKAFTEHCICLDVTDEQLDIVCRAMAGNKGKRDLDLSRVQLTRIFARGSMEKGGRFYRGWWQEIPSLYRPHITIDGLKTIEIDYTGVGIAIAYYLLDLPYDANADPYDIGLIGWQGKSDVRRKPIKQFVNALINDEEQIYRLPKSLEKVIGLTHEQLLRLVRQMHGAVVDARGDGIGLKAQFIDSKIAEKVMLWFVEDGNIVLPIHDSFIVRAGFEQYLSVAMTTAFREVTGRTVNIESEVVKSQDQFGMKTEEILSLQKYAQDTGDYSAFIATFDIDEIVFDTQQLMYKYLTWFESQKH